MKVHLPLNNSPMEIILELNKKHGTGYQARLVMGPISNTIDSEPFTLYEAAQGAQAALEEINRATGNHYELCKIMRITDEALRANKGNDFASAQMLHDIESGSGKLAVPAQTDYSHKKIDGKDEIVFTGRGTVLCTYFTWCDDKLPKAKEALQRYCEYLALHGYGVGASQIMDALLKMDKNTGSGWIKSSYGKYVQDDAAIIQYILG